MWYFFGALAGIVLALWIIVAIVWGGLNMMWERQRRHKAVLAATIVAMFVMNGAVLWDLLNISGYVRRCAESAHRRLSKLGYVLRLQDLGPRLWHCPHCDEYRAYDEVLDICPSCKRNVRRSHNG